MPLLPFVLVASGDPGAGPRAAVTAAARAGLTLPAAARRTPPEPGWHQLDLGGAAGGLLGRVTRRFHAPAATLAASLEADGWLADRVTAARDALRGEGGSQVTVVALDPAARAGLDRRSLPAPARLLGWDEAAEPLLRSIGEGRVRPAVPPGPGEGGEPSPPASSRPPGARHAVTVLGHDPRAAVGALDLPRVKVSTPGPAEPPTLPDPTDIVVLDGLGPFVTLLDQLPPTVPVVRIEHPGDATDPWRHLLPHRFEVTLSQTDAAGPGVLLDAVLGEDVAELAGLVTGREDDRALALAERMLAGGLPDDERRWRELSYVARVTGASGLEARLLRGRLLQADPDDPRRPAWQGLLDTVQDRLTETEPGWLPSLPPTPVEPVPGRVLHLLKVTIPQRQAGYSVRGHQTLVALHQQGVDVLGVALPPAGRTDDSGTDADAATEIATEQVLDGIRYLLPAPVAAPGGTAYLQQAGEALLDVVRAERPAVLHVHSGGRGYDLGVVGAALARATGLPWVYEVRGFFESLWTPQPDRAERGEVFTRRMAKEAELAASADATVTLAETMRADLVVRGVDRGQVSVVPNAVDPRAFAPAGRDPELARRWGTTGRFTIGYVTNLDHEREQIEDLVRATRLLRERGVDVRTLVVGDGARREVLEARARREGVADHVVFTGRVPHAEVAAAYSLLDVLVVPRSAERAARLVTPLKPYEAMALGVPVLVSDQPALLEIIGHGERGWSYPTGDAEALATVLQGLAADPSVRRARAERARGWVLTERTWAGNAQRYRSIYDRLEQDLSRAARGGPAPTR